MITIIPRVNNALHIPFEIGLPKLCFSALVISTLFGGQATIAMRLDSDGLSLDRRLEVLSTIKVARLASVSLAGNSRFDVVDSVDERIGFDNLVVESLLAGSDIATEAKFDSVTGVASRFSSVSLDFNVRLVVASVAITSRLNGQLSIEVCS